MPAVIVVGAGIVGASVAHHLALSGQTDVLVVDARQEDVLPGSTGLAPGFVGQLSGSVELSTLAMESVALYSELADPAGDPVFWRVGCLEVATTTQRLATFEDDVRRGRELGLPAEIIDAAAAAARAPGLVDDGMACGALFLPADGAADPVGITAALVETARQRGV